MVQNFVKLHTFWSISKQTRIFLEKRFYNRFSYRCLHILKVHLSPQPHSFLLGLRLEVICFPSQGCALDCWGWFVIKVLRVWFDKACEIKGFKRTFFLNFENLSIQTGPQSCWRFRIIPQRRVYFSKVISVSTISWYYYYDW